MTMTLDRAIEILNERKHRGHSEWERDQITGDPESLCVTGPDPHSDLLTPFEAVAIAEKYERDVEVSTTWRDLENSVDATD